MTTFDIYFSDLNPTAQKELLDLVKAKDPKDMNWDLDILPIATFEFEDEDDDLEPRCPRCGYPLLMSEVEGYTYYCPQCDEDFYSFEAR